MSLVGFVSRQILRTGFSAKSNFNNFGCAIRRRYSLWEPDYLILAETKTPEYDLINLQVKGYDFAVLEMYVSYIKRIASRFDVNVVKSWPAPQQDMVIHHYKPNSSEIMHDYKLKIYERNVQVVDVKSHIMPLFIETVVLTCPPGVDLDIHNHEDFMEEDLYVPNLEIAQLEGQLEEIGAVQKKKKRKKMKMGKLKLNGTFRKRVSYKGTPSSGPKRSTILTNGSPK